MPARQSPAAGVAGCFNAVQRLLTAWGTEEHDWVSAARWLPAPLALEALAVLQLAPSPWAVP